MTKDFVLSTEDLTVGYDSPIIRELNLHIKPGERLTLIGPNGSGKTTLLKSLAALLKPMEGCVYLDGRSAGEMSGEEVARRLASVMTERVKPELMTNRQVVETGRYPYTGRLGILGEEDNRAVDEAMAMMDVGDIADRLFTRISDGQRQRVMLAAALCRDPGVLILDEPVSYLDIRYKLDIMKKVSDIAREKNTAVVMSLHDPDYAMRYSDTVAAVGYGGTFRIGSVKEIFTENFIRSLYGIEDVDEALFPTKPWF